MFLKFLKRKKGKFKRNFALDFGSSYLKLISFEKRDKMIFLANFWKQEIEKYGVFNGKRFELDIIKKAVRELFNKAEKLVLDYEFPFVVNFSPKFIKVKIVELLWKRDFETEIKKDQEKEIFEKVIEKGKENIKKEQGEVNFLKAKILEIRILGYKVEKLEGKRAKEIFFKILYYFSEKNSIIEEIISEFKIKKEEIFSPLEGLIKLGENGLFLEIGANFSQLSLFVKKEISDFRVFSLGADEITRKISKKLNISEARAELLKISYSEDRLKEIKGQIREISLAEIKRWLKELEKNLVWLKKNYFIEKIYLFGGGSEFPLYVETLRRFFKNLEIKNLSLKEFKLIKAKKNIPLKFLPLILTIYGS